MKKACWLQYAKAVACVTMIVAGAIAAPLAEAQSIQVVSTFPGPAHPNSPLLQGTASTGGFLYGTITGPDGDIVFRLLPSDTAATTVSPLQCATQGCAAGGSVYGDLLQIGDLLYGTRSLGGSSNNRGTVFETNIQTGQSRAIHVFQANAGPSSVLDLSDGRDPVSGLTLSNGFLYGTTFAGGAHDRGTVYRVRPDGTEFAIVHSFGCASTPLPEPAECLAYGPSWNVIQLSDGFLYGTTATTAGTSQGLLSGTIYKLSTDGTVFQVIHVFLDYNATPASGLVGRDGHLYGVAANSGNAAGGTVYRIRPDGTGFLTLHPFQGPPNDGGTPLGPLFQASDNNLYGTTQRGGANDCGTVFSVTPGGVVDIVVKSFANATTGCFPSNGVIQASDGNLYGTTLTGGTTPGGSSGFGTIFRVPLPITPTGQPPAITNANSATFTVGVSSSFTVMTTGSPTPVLTMAGAFLNGLTFTDNGNGTATLAGTPASGTGGTYQMFFTASNGVSPNATQNFALTVNQSGGLPAPTSANACKKNGWKAFAQSDGTPFADQGSCISYVQPQKNK